MSVAIIDYGSGNLRSAAKAFERAEGEARFRKHLATEKSLAGTPNELCRAEANQAWEVGKDYGQFKCRVLWHVCGFGLTAL